MIAGKSLYRPDIDCLRAIAVVGVLLYHFEYSLFSGGFVGVDIFFVISGYLITKNIKNEIDENNFSFLKFYTRRIKRIFPAFLATVIITFLFGFLLFSPQHFEALSRSSLHAIASLSNILFWSKQGYFDELNQIEPLLHTWSLSVEEQFYLLWPMVLLFLFKLNNKLLSCCLISILGAISLVAAEFFIHRDPSTSFYLSPFRVYEFIIGAMAVYGREGTVKKLNVESIYIFGAAIVFCSIFLYDHNTPFPGINALVPCLGTYLMIISGEHSRVANSLNIRPILLLGLVSYSLYLVHWPIWVFFTYWKSVGITNGEKLMLVFISGFCAWLLYRFIEKPFRNGGVVERKISGFRYTIVFSFVTIFMVFTLSNAWSMSGWNWRIAKDARALTDSKEFHLEEYGGREFENTDILGDKEAYPSFILIGDSHAKAYAEGLSSMLNENRSSAVMLITHACLNLPGVTRVRNGKSTQASCTNSLSEKEEIIKKYDIPIVIAHRWSHHYDVIARHDGTRINFNGPSEFYDFLKVKILEFKRHFNDRKLVLIGSVPETKSQGGVLACMARPSFLPSDCELHQSHTPDVNGPIISVNHALRELAHTTAGIEYLDPLDYLCKDGLCKSIINSNIVYSDEHHLSKDGSRVFFEFAGNDFMKLIM